MEEPTTYQVRTERSGGWWRFTIRGVPRAQGQVRRLDQVTAEARALISRALGLAEDAFEVELAVKLDPRLEAVLDEAKAAREQVEVYQRLAQERLAQAAEHFRSVAGLGVRDIGSLLNVSFQRVSQILGERRQASS